MPFEVNVRKRQLCWSCKSSGFRSLFLNSGPIKKLLCYMYVSSMYAYNLHSLANLQSSALDSLETSKQPVDPRPTLITAPPPCFKISGSASDFILHPPLYIREFFHCWNARIKGYGNMVLGANTHIFRPPPPKKNPPLNLNLCGRREDSVFVTSCEWIF